MAIISLNEDGTVSALRSKTEINRYYDKEIERRINSMIKLIAFGVDVAPVQNRITELNSERKSKMTEEGR